MENTIPHTKSKHSNAPEAAEQKASDVDHVAENAVSLLLRLRQLGDYGLRQTMQFLADNE